MLTPRLAAKSLRNRQLASGLTVLSIALSVALLVGIENLRNGLRESFTGTVSGVDLVVGPRSSPVQLLLHTVFGLGSPAGSMDWETYRYFRDHPAVAWTIPYSLGDNHRGYRVVGTTQAFYDHFQFRGGRNISFREGAAPSRARDVVLGAEVAERLSYTLGEEIVVTHGMGAAGIMDHEESPFVVTGILDRTGTPVDRSIYMSLAGIEAMHEGWVGSVPPMFSFAPEPEDEAPEHHAHSDDEDHGHGGDHAHSDDDHVHGISAFFVGTPSRFEMLGLQREINDFADEPLTAILPGIALAELWRTVGYAEDGLKIVSFFVIGVGLLGMLVSLYTALEARRREMAIFRALGAGPRRIVTLLVAESGLLALGGAILGVVLVYGSIFLARGPVEQRLGLALPLRPLGTLEWTYLGAVVVAGLLIGLIPALKAYRSTLSDGLNPRT
jgi:putative ABC transport system permease protein